MVQSFLTVVKAFICYISRTLASGGLCVYNVCVRDAILSEVDYRQLRNSRIEHARGV